MADNITLVGNIASSPEPGRTATGIETLSFRLATNNRRPDPKTGTWIDAGTNWFTVRAYRWLAENARVSLSKGDSVIVVGRLRLREWDTKEGQRRIAVEIEAESIGPDLRWGRSAFHRVSHQTAPEPTRGFVAGDSFGSGTTADDRGVPVLVGGAGENPVSEASVNDGWAPAGEQQTPY